MNNFSKIIAGLGVAALFTACADEDIAFVNVNRPAGLDTYTYLDQYDVLKSYVNKQASPNFKLGAALAAADYNKRETVFALANTNFDEVVAGNAMKFASVVGEDGSLNYDLVESFVDATEAAGMTIYGHTLAWHSQQQPKWLNSLIQDKPDPNWVPPVATEELVKEDNFESYDKFPHYVMGYEPTMRDGNLVFINAGEWLQAFVLTGMPCKSAGEYIVRARVKGNGCSGNIPTQVRWSWGEDPASCNLKYTEEWAEVEAKVNIPESVVGGNLDVIMQPGVFNGELEIDWVALYRMVEPGKAGYVSSDAKPFTYLAYNNILETADGTAETKQLVARVYGAGGDVAAPLEDGGYVVRATAKAAEAWDNQFFIYSTDRTFEAGEKTRVTFRYKAAKAANASTQCHAAPGGYIHWAAIGDVEFKTEWQTFTKDFTIPSECDGKDMQSIAFNLNEFADANDYYFDDVTWSVAEERHTIVPNYGCEGNDMSGFIVKEKQGATTEATEANLADDGKGGKCIVVHAGDKVAEAWDTQFWINTPIATFDGGEKCKISFRYKADKNASASTQCHAEPGGYIHWAAIGNVDFTTEWKTFTWEGTIPGECAGRGMHSIAFNLNDFAEANNYYFDDIVWECEELTEVPDAPDVPLIPMTAEEKKDTLTWALDRFIAGMMKATRGKVVAWDLANETVDGVDNNGDGIYDQRSLETAGENDFIWQAYLGDVDYVVIAEKAARKHFAENGGKAEDLKLFINDFNLESWWDGNKKCASLIEWIKKWEAAGAKIDGIGTQMHVSFIANADDQKAQEAAIVNMFKMMAATGKLVRVSELDMGYCEKAFADGKKTSELTFEQEKQMSDFYKFIVKAYLENVPAAQQYGITQWCITDAPENSGWRGGEPVGLWTLGYERKPAYAGFAEGLQGK